MFWKLRLFCKVIFGIQIKWVGNTANNKSRPCRRKKGFFSLSPKILPFRYKANVFSSKRERTYEILLQDMYDNYWNHGTDWDNSRSNTGGSIKLYGNQRKVQEQMVRGTLILIKDFKWYFMCMFFLFRIFSSKWVKTWG